MRNLRARRALRRWTLEATGGDRCVEPSRRCGLGAVVVWRGTWREASWSNRTRWRKLRSIQTRDASRRAHSGPDKCRAVFGLHCARDEIPVGTQSLTNTPCEETTTATSGRLLVIISAVTACHSNARSRRITGVKTKRFNMSGGPYGGKSSLATVRVHRLARAPPRTGKYLDIATDRSVPRSLASSVHARRRGRGRTRLRSGDGHLHRPGTSRARLSSPSAPNPGMLTLARERTSDRSP